MSSEWQHWWNAMTDTETALAAGSLLVRTQRAAVHVWFQVKNFGRSGRTKYTHLVDQDTTQFDAPWADNSALNIKFHSQMSAGMKQSFERPTVKKRKWTH